VLEVVVVVSKEGVSGVQSHSVVASNTEAFLALCAAGGGDRLVRTSHHRIAASFAFVFLSSTSQFCGG
jgi:hypothetical protein